MLAYPNPSSSIINIPYKMTDKHGSMEIRGILGNLVETKSTDKGYNLITIDASYYANGIYFITLKDATGKTIASQKISIQH